ncbi:MAG: WD40/YVTN/BNR-like repeat-containing protein [Gemmatimonadota bacterium]
MRASLKMRDALSSRSAPDVAGIRAILSLSKTGHALAAAALTLALLPVPSVAQHVDPDRYSQLHYRFIGPVGNRVIAVAGVPGDPLTYYAGAATGGIWKTEDGGIYWRPVFDEEPVGSIGALAVAPSDPNVVWAGTGETFIRSNVSVGNGVYRSTDGGKTWSHMGLDAPSRIGRIVIHPGDPDLVYVASLGHAHGPQQERGVYRTRDGGRTWEKILFVNAGTGAIDLAMDPNNPRILFAAMWQIEVHQWGRESGGPGSGIWRSNDGGDTWTRLTGHGLPERPVGKIALCMTRRNSSRIYALIETGDGVPWHGHETDSGELWRSDDGGGSWKLVSHDRDLAGRTAYYTRCAVAPDDEDEAYFLAAAFSVTHDGGTTSVNTSGPARPGYDHHDMWIDPTDGDRMIVSHDGGVSISENRGASWRRVELPVAQMYHVTVDDRIPYYVYGNRQDGPSVRGPSNSRQFGFFAGGIPRGAWREVGGGESGFATPDTVDPDIVWSSASGAGARGGIVVRYEQSRHQYRQVEVWPESTGGWPAESLKYRFQWTFPLLISPHDHHTVYVTSQYVHRTTNDGKSWEVISPDLTTNDKSRQGISGGLTPDNIGVEYCCVIYAFDESPARKGVLWAGSNDGLVHVSRDGGKTWTDVTGHIPDLPPDGVVRNLDASKWDAGKAYLSVEFHFDGNFDPYIFKTEDYGEHWKKITDGIPPGPTSFVRNVREDPVRPGLLYAGTESALYVSFDDGGHWQPLQMNLPHTPVYWIAVQERFHDLVVGTYGRGFWILDDLTPLEQLTPEVASSAVHLFNPRPAYRFRSVTTWFDQTIDPSHGDNPPYGASLNYWLGSKPEGEVELTITNADGDTIRTLKGSGDAGINRVWWDLRYESTEPIKLRTSPLYAPDIRVGEKGWRPMPGGFGGGGLSVLVPPGTYTVTLRVGGEARGTREFKVLKDPNTAGSEADIHAQTVMLLRIRDDMNATAEKVNRIELVRKQLQDLDAVLGAQEGGSTDTAGVREAAKSLEKKLIEVEGRLIQLKLTGEGQDRIRWPTMLWGRLSYLASGVSVGDYPPADEAGQVLEVLEGRLEAAGEALDELVRADVPAFQRLLRERDIPNVIAAVP